MHALSGPFFALGLLVVIAGAAKLRRPGSTRDALRSSGMSTHLVGVRALGVAEITVGAAAVVVGGTLTAAALGVLYGAFTVFALRARRAGIAEPCGCFGTTAPVGPAHLVVNLAAIGVCGVAAADPVSGVATTDAGVVGLGALVGMAALAAAQLRLVLTRLPVGSTSAAPAIPGARSRAIS